MQVLTEKMVRAGMALQVAALEWDGDTSQVQSEARQAILGLRQALNDANHALALMDRESAARRHPDSRKPLTDAERASAAPPPVRG